MPTLPPRAILLTGATGFLGVHLLVALLRRTDARIYCLARDDHPGAAITRQLRAYGLWQSARPHARRIIPVRGDLAEVNCGLSAEDWRLLADEADMIVHCGARVNFVYPYEALRAANVLGTQTLLRLALEGRAKAFHFISTFSVFDMPEYADRAAPILEDEFPTSARTLVHAYGQSKWRAETLVQRAARDYGLPTAIYRPGRVTGHSSTGQGNPSDLLDLVVEGCVELGAAPNLPITLDMTPVDYVAEAIAVLVCQPATGAAYHLVNPQPTTSAKLLALLRQRGYPLETLPYNAWRERIRETEQARLAAFLPLFTDDLPAVLSGAPVFHTRNTTRGLAGSGITCPPADDALLSRYIAYLVEQSGLPAARRSAAHTAVQRA